MKIPTVMGHKFSEVPKAEIQRSQFDRSFGYKTTFNAGYLIPFYVDEALPGDTFSMALTAFARLSTPLVPIMDNIYMDTFFFSVPNRLVWNNWQKFNGEQEDPGDSTDYTVPVMDEGNAVLEEGSIYDYMGLPVGDTVTGNIKFNALHLRAYNLIWNEWFRDENMQESLTVAKGDSSGDPAGYYALQKRGKRHDYFTSCLPWAQKGDSVVIPLGDQAPIIGLGTGGDFNATSVDVVETGSLATVTYPESMLVEVDSPDAGDGKLYVKGSDNPGYPEIYADLSNASDITINELRQSFQLQKMLERDARGGTRYTEVIRAHFGVTSPDARLQRPEYLGGGSTPIHISPIAQNSSSDAQPTPQGNLAAIGTASISGHGFTKSFTEHCLLIGMVSVRADLTYQQGLDRMWSRQTRYDFFWPALAHIGEQAVLTQEIYCTGSDANDETVFGYQERFAEYRYKPSKITGEFRSNADTPLDMWHLSQEFGSAPTLDDTFIEETPPIDRIVAVPSEPQFLFDSYAKLTCARPMPVYGVPGLIDHF